MIMTTCCSENVIIVLNWFLCICMMFQMPLKKLYMLVEMAAQGAKGGSSEAIYSGKEKMDINHFFDILGDIVTYRG